MELGLVVDEQPALDDLQVRAIELLATGRSQRAIAKMLGVGRTTLWRWQQDPSFATALARLGDDLRRDARRRIHALLDTSVEILAEQLNHPKNAERVRAATTLLRLARVGEPGSKR